MLPFDELVLHKYRIRRAEGRRDGLLGRGTFGSVYLAHEELAVRDVAIKELQVDASELGAQQEEALRRFLTEGRLGLRVRHPNILEVYAIEPFDDGYLLVMELAESGDLKGMLQRGRPNLAQAVSIGVGIARGLQAAHERGIVHRDLKPGNVFLMEDGTPKVADFGVAHIPEAMGGYLSMTRTGFQPGTVIYMSPEQAQGRRADHRSDLYSLAVILFELLTGSFYVDIERCSELARTRARVAPALSELHFVWAFTEIAFAGPLPRPSERNPEVPAWLDAVVLRGLERDPAQRFQSGREFAEALAAGRLPSGTAAASAFDMTLVDRPAPVWSPAEPAVADLYTPRSGESGPKAPPGDPTPAGGAGEAGAGSDLPLGPATSDEPVLFVAPPSWSQSAQPGVASAPEAARQATPAAPPEAPIIVPPATETAHRGGDAAAGSGAVGGQALMAAGQPAVAEQRKGRRRKWLLVLGALVLLVVGVTAGFALARRSPSKPTATPPTAFAGAASLTASPAAVASQTPAVASQTPAAASPSGTAAGAATAGAATAAATARPAVTATSADTMDVARLLRPGATLVKQAAVPGAGAGDAGQLVVYSQAPGSGGCQRPYLDVYRRAANGAWTAVWDATRQPAADKPLLPALSQSGERCFPNIEFFDVRPLVNGGGLHAVASIDLDADGRRRLIDINLTDAAKPVALDFDLTTTPAASPPEFTEGLPQSLRVTQNAYPPQASGVNGGYDKPIGTLDSLLRWDDAAHTFKPISQQLSLNCDGGAITALGGAAIQIRCGDGRYSAVAVTGKTNYGAGTTFAGLRTGDSVIFTTEESSLAIADPLNALPTASAILRAR